MPTYSAAIKTQARINWNILITLNFAYWPESISAAMGSVETQEHPPAKPHGPAHTDTQGAERLGRGFWSRPQQMWSSFHLCGRKAWSVPSLLHLSLLHKALVISIIYFMDHAFGVISKKSSPYPRLSRYSPMLSSRSFILLLLYLGLWSIVSYFLWKVYDLSVNSFFLYVNVQFHHQLLKRLCKVHCKRSVDSIYVSPFLGSLFSSTDLFVCFFRQHHTLLITVTLY